MVVLSSALLGAYLLLSTGTSALPTTKKDYTNGHGPSVALYDAMSNGDFTGDITRCSGYKLNGVQTSSSGGILADLSLNGKGCKAFGNDIENLVLSVEYETEHRLHVHIYDRDKKQYQLPNSIWPRPEPSSVDAKTSDLVFNHDPAPFAFWITRRSSGEIIFDTRASSIPTYDDLFSQNGQIQNGTAMPAHPLIFEDQYLQLSTAMPENANVYGLGEWIDPNGFARTTNGSITTHWARDAGDPVNGNMYGSHNQAMVTLWNNSTASSSSHGIFMLNPHGLDILMRPGVLEYRVIGGTLDMYFVAGPRAIDVHEQYSQIVGTTQDFPYWAFGFHLCRWGYTSVEETRSIVDSMRAANIPLEVMYNDIDWMKHYRNFDFDPNFAPEDFGAFVKYLRSQNQHYIPIIDAAFATTYNDSDVYQTYTRGAELDVWLKNPDGSEYRGRVWPGVTVFPDFSAPNSEQFWYEAYKNLSDVIPFSGIWEDMNEPSSFCEGSCGSDPRELANTSTPFPLPGEPGGIVTGYPECYDISLGTSGNITIGGVATCRNATELAKLMKREQAIEGVDVIASPEVNFPAYAIHNGEGALNLKTVATNATNHDGVQQYHIHNIFGYQSEVATQQALLKVNPGVRPFLLSRSTFPGSGKHMAHWLGDNYALWEYMKYSIQGVLQFQLFQIPMVGADVGGFNRNTDEELANRWHSLGAFTPFFRNHNTKTALSQEPFRWDSVAEAARTAIKARYQLLPYWLSLFADAAHWGTPVARALFYEFDDVAYANIDEQFMIGDSLLVTPVLRPNATTVTGYLPPHHNTMWRNWFTHEEVGGSKDKVTLDAPLGTINVHIRSGSALLTHRDAGYTLTETRESPYSMLVYLDHDNYADGCTKIDDGISYPVTERASLTFTASTTSIKINRDNVMGNYQVEQPIAQLILLGVAARPTTLKLNGQALDGLTMQYDATLKKLVIDGLGISLNESSELTWS
ncbi:hypothetical protein QFC22_005053 [Naganishia vaughanmartiniae]|uniref:Uncharacterized protein n=1 Tax=Naganishia vaughanmartiniae TaxID=1424756 RepID=A0ACC2WX68_9TREE|nr:hypothetical protein QFC22_005053 [Naganishia vaughanmartiniae]